MANRPIFFPTDNKDEPVSLKKVDFTWYAGLSKSQKQKSILSNKTCYMERENCNTNRST